MSVNLSEAPEIRSISSIRFETPPAALLIGVFMTLKLPSAKFNAELFLRFNVFVLEARALPKGVKTAPEFTVIS